MHESALLEPISPDAPCGEDLEDTQLLASFDAFRLFGQATPLSAETDWREIRDRSEEALGKSKDFRLLAHLGAALLRTDSFDSFAGTVGAASKWLENWWDQVYPKVDEDAVLRRNALNSFADRMAVIDGVRRVTLVANRQLGQLSIRDMEIAAGQMPKPEGEERVPDSAYVNAILSATELEELEKLRGTLDGCQKSLKSIESIMSDKGGSEAAPDFTSLTPIIARTTIAVASHIKSRSPAEDSTESNGADGAADGAPVGRGPIRSRDDAIRALDAIAAFFRNSEPSSPVPLFIERAKRLVAKDFLAVLEDMVPDAVSQAKAVGGVRDSE